MLVCSKKTIFFHGALRVIRSRSTGGESGSLSAGRGIVVEAFTSRSLSGLNKRANSTEDFEAELKDNDAQKLNK